MYINMKYRQTFVQTLGYEIKLTSIIQSVVPSILDSGLSYLLL